LVARSLLVGLAHADGSASSSSSARRAASAFSTSRSSSAARLTAFFDGPAGLARPLAFDLAAFGFVPPVRFALASASRRSSRTREYSAQPPR
jgi:hypothetical protein